MIIQRMKASQGVPCKNTLQNICGNNCDVKKTNEMARYIMYKNNKYHSALPFFRSPLNSFKITCYSTPLTILRK